MIEIVDFVKSRFGMLPTYDYNENRLLIHVKGLDNYSLGNYIYQELDNIKVTVEEKEGYKISDLGWIKIEKSDKKELVKIQCGI